MNKKYTILLSAFIACTSMSKEDKTVVIFPKPINRFAISRDGNQFVTSEDETESRLNGSKILHSTIRVWQKNSDGLYRDTKVKKLNFTLKRGFALRWLNDNQRIALLTFFHEDNNPRKCRIEHELYDAETLEPAGRLNRRFTTEEVDRVSKARCTDSNAIDGEHTKTSVGHPLSKNHYFEIDQNKLTLQTYVKQ